MNDYKKDDKEFDDFVREAEALDAKCDEMLGRIMGFIALLES